MNILVTGGAGYVGSTLVPLLLADGHRVRVLDSILHGGESLLGVWPHPGFEFVRGDICDRSVLKEAVAGIESVVHLAAIVGDPACSRQPDLARAVNLDASLALIEESKRAGVNRFVFASTCSNYGRMKDPNVYVDEESELSPVSLYAETKVAIEKALLDSGSSGRWCPTPLRFATVFGVSPRMRFDLTVNEFTMEMLTKKHLKVFGEQFWRPYIHVHDAARAVRTVLEAPREKTEGEVFNAGRSDENYTKQMLVEAIREQVDRGTVTYVERREDPRDYKVSFDKIHRVLRFETNLTVPQGIAEIARAFDEERWPDPWGATYRNTP